MKNITNNQNNQKEVRLKDKHRHFLGKIVKGTVYLYCSRCKGFYKVMMEGGEEFGQALTN